MSVVIETTIGDITVDLFLKERPRACQNFLKLCKLKYYNFCLFHTVQRDFIAQTGDPEGTGKGGTSLYGILYGDQAKYFEAEKTPKLKHQNTGTLSFASHGGHMLGSQFFFTLAEQLDYLDGEHCVFGQVVEGLDVLVKLNSAICDDKHQPYQDIRITHTVVLDDPLDDPAGLQPPDRSPPLTDDILNSGRIAADEDLEESGGRTAEELEELIEDREARARATILEMVGDLPDADSAPPENVLFVCKLNPVTTDDDLQIIFSRFGRVVSCEIIRDQKTGNSLQYGFIEFDNPKSCENAYFKMDNVLIDDRRIHVDFSQSVSKVKWRGRGKISYESGTSAAELAQMGGGGGGGGRGRGRGGGRGQGGRGGPPGRPTAHARDRGDRDHDRGRGYRNHGDRDRDRDHDRGRGNRNHGDRDRDRDHGDRGRGDRDRGGGEQRRSKDAGRDGSRLDVGQLKALLAGEKEKSDSEGSTHGARHNKKAKKHKKKSRRDSSDHDDSSGSDSKTTKGSKKHRQRSPDVDTRIKRENEVRNKRQRSPSPDGRHSRKESSRDKRRHSRSPDDRSRRRDDIRDKKRRSRSPEERPSTKGDSRTETRRSRSPRQRPRKEDDRDNRRPLRSPDVRRDRRDGSDRRRPSSPDNRRPEPAVRERRGRSPSPDTRRSKRDEPRRRSVESDEGGDRRSSKKRRDESTEKPDKHPRKSKKHSDKDGDREKKRKKKKKRRRSTSSESSSSSEESSGDDRRKRLKRR